jgi:hypothetical protein
MRGDLGFIASSGPPDPQCLTRASDRLDQARVIVLDVADPRDDGASMSSSPPERRCGSFDYLIGTGENRRRDRQPERLGGIEIDHQLEGGRLLHRQIGRLCAFEDSPRVTGCLAKERDKLDSITDEATGRSELSQSEIAGTA